MKKNIHRAAKMGATTISIMTLCTVTQDNRHSEFSLFVCLIYRSFSIETFLGLHRQENQKLKKFGANEKKTFIEQLKWVPRLSP